MQKDINYAHTNKRIELHPSCLENSHLTAPFLFLRLLIITALVVRSHNSEVLVYQALSKKKWLKQGWLFKLWINLLCIQVFQEECLHLKKEVDTCMVADLFLQLCPCSWHAAKVTHYWSSIAGLQITLLCSVCAAELTAAFLTDYSEVEGEYQNMFFTLP